jgi:hypothetical protein
MTAPHVPVVASPPTPTLRPVQHPDLSDFLWHFCSRTRRSTQDVPDYIRIMSPAQRLESILWERGFRAHKPYIGPDPIVSFTEATINGINFMVQQRSYQPWGLIFNRQSVYSAGGGPVWHVRDDVLAGFDRDSFLSSWAVRLGQGSDWLEEREWRIVRPVTTPGVATGVGLHELKLAAILVGDPTWTGARQDLTIAAAANMHPWTPFYPLGLGGVPRFWWNPELRGMQLLDPFYA